MGPGGATYRHRTRCTRCKPKAVRCRGKRLAFADSLRQEAKRAEATRGPSLCLCIIVGCSSQVRSGQLLGSSQPAKSTESNPCPVLFQNHHVAVAESAVIGYPHEIKGEGKMLSFLPRNISPGAMALQWEVAPVAVLCPHHTVC